MKSGNLLFSKVPIPAKQSKDEGKLDFVRFANRQSAFFFFPDDERRTNR